MNMKALFASFVFTAALTVITATVNAVAYIGEVRTSGQEVVEVEVTANIAVEEAEESLAAAERAKAALAEGNKVEAVAASKEASLKAKAVADATKRVSKALARLEPSLEGKKISSAIEVTCVNAAETRYRVGLAVASTDMTSIRSAVDGAEWTAVAASRAAAEALAVVKAAKVRFAGELL